MRAACFTYDHGAPAIGIRDVGDPTPGRGEAVVRVEACALNHSDLWTLDGGGYEDPHVAGSDVAGVVESVEGSDAVSPGDRVVACPNRTCGACAACRDGPENQCESYGIARGGFAERYVCPADRLVRLPDGASMPAAAALPISYMTAWRMLRLADVVAGDVVLVPGATGGVGTAAVQLAGVLGARTVGTTGSPRKADALRDLGVDRVVVADTPDAVRGAAADETVDAVVNHVGGGFTGAGLDALRRGGVMAVCGRSAGREPGLDLRELFWEHKRVVGTTMGTQSDLSRLVGLVAAGRLDPVVDARYSLADLADAVAAMRDREAVGKLVLEP